MVGAPGDGGETGLGVTSKGVREASPGDWVVLRAHWRVTGRDSKEHRGKVATRVAATLQANWDQKGGARPLVPAAT